MNWKKRKKNKISGFNGAPAQKPHLINIFLGGHYMKWRVDYVVGNTYKVKYVIANSASQAIKKARVKNIVDLNIVE